MTVLKLNDLPAWSPWPARLLGAAPWGEEPLNPERIESEYNRGKYRRCIEFFEQAGDAPSPKDVKRFELGIASDKNVVLSYANDLHRMPFGEVRRLYYDMILTEVRSRLKNTRSLLELGGRVRLQPVDAQESSRHPRGCGRGPVRKRGEARGATLPGFEHHRPSLQLPRARDLRFSRDPNGAGAALHVPTPSSWWRT